jgi:hypothetical protein
MPGSRLADDLQARAFAGRAGLDRVPVHRGCVEAGLRAKRGHAGCEDAPARLRQHDGLAAD